MFLLHSDAFIILLLVQHKECVQAFALAIKEFSNVDLMTLKNEGLSHNENIMQNYVML